MTVAKMHRGVTRPFTRYCTLRSHPKRALTPCVRLSIVASPYSVDSHETAWNVSIVTDDNLLSQKKDHPNLFTSFPAIRG